MDIHKSAAMFVLALAMLGWPQARAQSLSATFAQPANGARVSGSVEARGTLSGPLPANTQLWIVVKQGGLMWPKAPAVDVVGQNWSKTVDVGGRGRYQLVLLLVDRAGQAQIARWIRHGNATHDFPGLAHIRGAVLAQLAIREE